uniref:NADH dehydrogenase subunit 5 n=1 Tax=Balta maculata TaxID=3037036 RepID=UPI00279BDA12|nr:NADH dehydrogenase subunit 5 [Balta maculata]WGO57139.1 NADH dehydrogenase subunit 5 [Balta maculata]
MTYMSICFIGFVFLFIFGLTLISLSIFYILNSCTFFVELELITLNSSEILMTILFDWMSLIFMGFVMFISSLVILYSGYYMYGDDNMNRFIWLVLLFVLSMMFLIISPNVISILLGWDGLGLVSYCLVIYYQNVKSNNAGMLTALSNRVGDVFLLMVIAWMLNFGSWNYIFYLDFYSVDFDMVVIVLMIIMAALTSSAQIPFSSWLPAAMAAPTPVSALVHSSTLVTAGVYLLIRFSISLNVYFCSFLLFVSGLTMFMSGLGANFEFDLKKIIALSTLSQLGLMMGVLSLGYPDLAFFHLLMHALFSALLFMCAGVYIHCMLNIQDIRYMGSFSFYMPFTSSCLMISNFSLCGFPFLAGFYSSDLMLELVSMSYLNLFSYSLFYLSTGLTVSYSFRLFYYLMCGEFNLVNFYFVNEDNNLVIVSMLLMSVMVIFGGSLFSWILLIDFKLIILPLFLKFMVIFFSLVGLILGYELAGLKMGFYLFSLSFIFVVNFFGSMWFMPYIFTYGISYYPLFLGFSTYKIFDSGWNEYFGGQGLFNIVMLISSVNQLWQFNNLKLFLLLFIMMFILLFVINF